MDAKCSWKQACFMAINCSIYWNLQHVKISLATYFWLKPSNVKLQGRIPFCQSCEKCQNFENGIGEITKYMMGIPKDITECVESHLCSYNGYFS